MTTALITTTVTSEVDVDLYCELHNITRVEVEDHIRQFINSRLEGLELVSA